MKMFLSLLSLLLAGCAVNQYNTIKGVPNLRMVGPGIYRGGQPADSNSWYFLVHELHLTNDVKLNLEKEGSDAVAQSLGCTVYAFPIDIWQQLAAKPSSATISNAVAHITPGTYFHCEHGEDRTGLVAACYRVWRDHWQKQSARKEMLQYGFHRSLHGLDDYFEDDVN